MFGEGWFSAEILQGTLYPVDQVLGLVIGGAVWANEKRQSSSTISALALRQLAIRIPGA